MGFVLMRRKAGSGALTFEELYSCEGGKVGSVFRR